MPSKAATLSARCADAAPRRVSSTAAWTEPEGASAASTSISARASTALASSAATVAGRSARCSRYAFGKAANNFLAEKLAGVLRLPFERARKAA